MHSLYCYGRIRKVYFFVTLLLTELFCVFEADFETYFLIICYFVLVSIHYVSVETEIDEEYER